MTVLILGGTAEARALAEALVRSGSAVISSLAGRVSAPALPAGEVRIGGFGGAEPLARFLDGHHIAAVVDATHPFAAQISRHAVAAASAARRPLLRLERPGWQDHPRAAEWSWVADAAGAVAASHARHPFLTTGRQSLRTFLAWSDRDVLVRVVEPPTFELPARWQLIRSRGPYAFAPERQLMLDYGRDLLVTKDSGGAHTRAKLDAAGDLGVPVVIISRPVFAATTPSVPTVQEALRWLNGKIDP